VLLLLFHLRINVGQFPVCALYCNNTLNKVTLLYRERAVNDISYNRTLDATCHRNLETAYLKDLEEEEEEGGGEGKF
jgi:hypothetical protein